MRFPIHALLAAILLAACQSSPVGPGAGAAGNADGLTARTAVKVASIAEERAWIGRHYPGAEIESQSLVTGRVPMDIIEIRLPSGEVRHIHFDISSFFGKW